MISAVPYYYAFLILILGGLTFIVLMRAFIRFVQLGPIGWFRDSLRIGDDFWMPFAVLIWVIMGALFALVWAPSGLIYF